MDKQGNKRTRDKEACTIGVDYEVVERTVLAELAELTPDQLETKAIPEATVQNLIQQQEGIDKRMLELGKELGDTSESAPSVPQIKSAILELQQRRDGVQKEIDAMRQAQAAAGQKPLDGIRNILGFIESKPVEERQPYRLRLRTLVAQVVGRVTLRPFKRGHRTDADIVIDLKPAGTRTIKSAATLEPKHGRLFMDVAAWAEGQQAIDEALARGEFRESWMAIGPGADNRTRDEEEIVEFREKNHRMRSGRKYGPKSVRLKWVQSGRQPWRR